MSHLDFAVNFFVALFALIDPVGNVALFAAATAGARTCFLATPLKTRARGRNGLTIVVRVLGLVLCALAAPFVLTGLAQSTTGIFRLQEPGP